MMRTVSMTVSHLYQNLKTINAQSHSVDAPSPLVWGVEITCVHMGESEKVYIGETGRQLGTRITEHRKEAEKISD